MDCLTNVGRNETAQYAALATQIRLARKRHVHRRLRWQVKNAGLHPVRMARELLDMPRRLFGPDEVLSALENLSCAGVYLTEGPAMVPPRKSSFASFMLSQVAA